MTASALQLPSNPSRSGNRGNATSKPNLQAGPLTLDPSWTASYDDRLVNAVRAGASTQRQGVSLFLDSLRRSSPNSIADRVLKAFMNDERSSKSDEPAYEISFVEAFREWQAAILNGPGQKSPSTRYQLVSRGKAFIEKLSREGHRGIPVNFRATWITTPSPPDSLATPSLGESPWPELVDFQGMSRERRALELVRDDYLRSFLAHERFFLFGQSILRGDTPPGTCVEARSMIREVLELYRRAFMETGRATIGTHQPIACAQAIHDIDLWRRAGAPDVTELVSGKRKFHAACQASLGPTLQMVDAAQGVLLCDTGWNVQPMDDLPRDPFLFASEPGAQIVSEEFLTSFKKRAGTTVLAYLERRGPSDPGWLAMAKPIWNEVVEEHGSEVGADGHFFLKEADDPEATSGIEVLRRYMAAADTIRHWSPVVSAFEGMWVGFINTGDLCTFHSETRNTRILRGAHPGAAVLDRQDFTRKAIRKTVLLLVRSEASSIVAAATFAGHQTKGTILPHYLNTPPVNAALDASIRGFQDPVEVLVMEGLDEDVVALRLGRTPADLHRLRMEAQESGLDILFGLCPEEEDGEEERGPLLEFRATPENLAELYLVHLALRRMQTFYPNHARFREVYLPLLAICKLIGRTVFEKHLGRAYWIAARIASKRLRNREITLPEFED